MLTYTKNKTDEDKPIMKELEFAKTKIGEKVGLYKERQTIFTIYYGNHLSPTIDGDFVHLKENEYLQMLNNFLSKNREYRVPDESEIRKACLDVINSEISFLENSKKKEERKEVVEEQIEVPERKDKKRIILAILLTVIIVTETFISIYLLLS